jgi:hypothetical protein
LEGTWQVVSCFECLFFGFLTANWESNIAGPGWKILVWKTSVEIQADDVPLLFAGEPPAVPVNPSSAAA